MAEDERLETNVRESFDSLPSDVNAFGERLPQHNRYGIGALEAHNNAVQTADNKYKPILPYIGVLVFLEALSRLKGKEYLSAARELFKDYLKETSGWDEARINKYFKTPAKEDNKNGEKTK
jgi:hypothetical protein